MARLRFRTSKSKFYNLLLVLTKVNLSGERQRHFMHWQNSAHRIHNALLKEYRDAVKQKQCIR